MCARVVLAPALIVVEGRAQVWLIEINSSPGVAQRLHSRLARDLIRTAIDTRFTPASPSLTPRPAGSRSQPKLRPAGPRPESRSPLSSPKKDSMTRCVCVVCVCGSTTWYV